MIRISKADLEVQGAQATKPQEISVGILCGGVLIWLLRRHTPLAPHPEAIAQPTLG